MSHDFALHKKKGGGEDDEGQIQPWPYSIDSYAPTRSLSLSGDHWAITNARS
jgi:hypothetical protein